MRGLYRSIVAVILVCAAHAGPASAAREFPADAALARFSVVQYPTVSVGRKTLQLAPGAQIRNEANLVVMPASLGGSYPSLYTLDRNGEVFRVWLLTDDEVKALKSQGR